MVAGLTSKLYLETKTLEPTGTAVSVYSPITAERISFCLVFISLSIIYLALEIIDC